MQSRLFVAVLIPLVVAGHPFSACAQLVADGATNTLNNVPTTITGDVTVGTNGSFTLLILTNNALLTNSGIGYLGRNVGANSNTVRLAGANTRWLMSGDLSAGRDGAANQLVVSNSSVVRNNYSYLGYNTTSSNNVAVVSGAGSLWTSELDFYVGFLGMGNQLKVSDSGVVRSSSGYLGFFSTGNVAVVTGPGSLWTNALGLAVGYNGGGNQLVVSNGGVVRNTEGYLGYGSTSDGNAAVVTGAGSLWTNELNLIVGYDGSGNQLLVSNGGRVGNADCYLGLYGGSNNLAVVSGAGSLWTMATNLYVGFNGGGNQVVVSNGGVVRDETCHLGCFSSKNLVVVTDAGSLWTNTSAFVVGSSDSGNQLVVTNGGVVRAKLGVVGSSNVSSNNVAVVTGTGSLWANEEKFYVGFNGRGNQLVVSNGGVVLTMDGYIGSANLGRDNAALVTGVGSRWTSAFDLVVGYYGSGNQLVVSDGGVVRNTMGTVGNFSGANSNLARVTGAGSLWTNSGSLVIGKDGAFNQLIVSASGVVRAGAAVTLGNSSLATNNSVLAVGGSLASVGLTLGNAVSRNNSVTLLSGSIWNLGGGTFTWGNAGSNDTLTIDATSAMTNIGGLTLDENATAFYLTNAPGGYTLNGFTTNQFQFSPTGAGAVIVGNDGGNIQFTISDSTLASTTGIVGNNAASRSNLVLVTGAGSVWSNSSSLNIGNSGAFNQLVVSNGGAVRAGGLVTLGNVAGSTNNSVLAVGGSLASVGLTLGGSVSRNNSITLLSNSIWDVGGGTFTWGNAGINDTLTIDATSSMTNIGGLTLDENATTFYMTNAPGGYSLNGFTTNQLKFKPAGLGAVVVGNDGANVQLTISNYTLSDTTGTVGNNVSAISNSVFVTGAGSVWSNSSALTIGKSGAFNQLVISNAGTVSAATGVVVGGNGPALNNLLLLSTGALLTNGGAGVIGFNTGANANTVSLSDVNTRWLMNGTLFVGSNGALNRLVISNGALLGNGIGYVGFNSSSSNNQVLVTGTNSYWSNLFDLNVGYSGSRNHLVISNGGRVGNDYGYVGFFASSSNNQALVTGTNSYWSNRYDLHVGVLGAGNRLVINDGGLVGNQAGIIGGNPSSSSNEVLVSGAGSFWNIRDALHVGSQGGGNRLVISNGALVANGSGFLGAISMGGNETLVTGAGSFWSNRFNLTVGNGTSGNRLVISNGGLVRNHGGYVGGSSTFSSSNEVVVIGPDSSWINQSDLYVGYDGSGNRLVLTNGGTAFASSGAYLGLNSSSINNLLTVGGGGLIVTNPAGSGVLDVRRGSNIVNAGLIDADRLLLTNSAGFFIFNGGTLKTKGTTNSNGQPFTVGNGTSVATFELASNGLHTFSSGLAIANNALLRGNGTLSGTLTVAVGGTLSPGTSIAKIVLSNSPSLLGNVIMEISKSGAVLTNDQVQLAGTLTYGGSLTVSNLGPDTLILSNRFPLFSASSYAGTFSSITLPPLAPGLAWTNKLGVDGSIEVIASAVQPVTLSVQSSNNVLTLIWSTNASSYCLETTLDLAPPVFWQTVNSGIAINGDTFVFSLTNNPAIAKQFFRLAFPCSTALTPVSLTLQLSNSVVTVIWPSNAFRLETTFNLAPPVAWQTVSNGISDVGAARAFTFTNNPAITNQFFRLAYP